MTKTQSAYGVTGLVSDDATGTYNDNGTLATVADAEGNKTTYEHDGFDRLLKTRYPSTTVGAGTSSTTDYEQLTYDASSEVTARRLRDGNSIGYSYDHLGRLTAKDLPGTEPDIAYAYDNLGRLTAATDAGSNFVGYAYDALGRATAQSSSLGVVGMGYDLAGHRTLTVWPDNFYVTYDYDTVGEMTAIRENGASSGLGVLATYTYDDLGRRTGLTRGNGTSSSFGYDNVSRLTSLGLNLDGSGTANDLTLGFSYSPASQIAGTTRSNDGYAWMATDRNIALAVNGLNQFVTVGAGSVTYDSKGNLSSTGSNSYTYSSENLLLTGPSSASLTYDPLLRLYQESGSSVPATRFLYDGRAMIGEYDSSAVMQRRYVMGPGSDEPLVEYDKSGSGYIRVWLHADERGSIIAESDDLGAKTAINSYNEYGIPGPGNTGRFGYTGQAWLPSLGLYYYKARIYSARLGRFMQTDPIGYADGLNAYNYTGADPINRGDSDGTMAEWMWNCYGDCGGGGYWNTGLAGLGTPQQQAADGAGATGTTSSADGSNNGADYAPTSRTPVPYVTGDVTVTANLVLPLPLIDLRGLLRGLFQGGDLESGRAVNITDLGVTVGRTVTVVGTIKKDTAHDSLLIYIQYMKATSSNSLLVMQSLGAARAAAKQNGLSNIIITGRLANERLDKFMRTYAMQNEDSTFTSIGGMDTLSIRLIRGY